MDNKIKKIFLIHYHFDKVAGTERVLYNIIEHLCQSGKYDITLILLKDEHDLVFDISKFPIKIVFLGVKTLIKSKTSILVNQIRIYRALIRFFGKVKLDQDAIILATNIYLALSSFLVKKRLKLKELAVVSCEHFTITATSKLTDFVRSLFYKNIHVVMLTANDRDTIAKKYKPLSTVCIPNAIPFTSLPYHKNDYKVILAVGRFTYQKGFDLLIESFGLIANDFPNWTLKIIGDDYGDKPLVEKLIREKNIANVQLLPATNEIYKHFSNASFFVMSSRFEGLPMVLLEALGYGLPIVSFKCPTGPEEIIDNTNGFLVENGNTYALATAMKSLMSNDALIADKAKGSQEKAKLFDKISINKMWDDFFESI